MTTFNVKYIICGVDQKKENTYLDGTCRLRLIQYPITVDGSIEFSFDSEYEALSAAKGKSLGSFTILKIYHE